MSESQVIALKFRPKTFDQVVGQEAITRTLKNAVANGTLHHAYLFSGARGVGKTTTARILAKALNCDKAPTTDPCGQCSACLDIAAGKSMLVIEIDAASNTGVDNVREVIINSAAFAPPPGRYKMFIIDEVHQLSTQAFNALLKTIEEPPPRVVFIMATTEMQKVPDTIMSRCQIFEFRTIPLSKIIDELARIADQLGVRISETALLTIARAGDGSMRDSESALDQVISFAGKDVSGEDVSNALGLVSIETLNSTLRAIADQDASAVLRIVDDVVTRGYDLRNYCRDLMAHIRAVLTVKITGFDHELVQLPDAEAQALTDIANRFSEQDLVRFFAILTKTEQDLRVSPQPRFQLEIGLVKVAHAARLYLIEEALARLQAIQSSLGLDGQSGRGQAAKEAPPRSAQSFGSTRPPVPARAVEKPGAGRSTSPPAPTITRTGPPASYSEAEGSPRPMYTARTASGRAEAGPEPEMPSGTGAASHSSPSSTDQAPPEPPPMTDEPYDEPAARDGSVDQSSGQVEKIMAVLRERRKSMVIGALEHAEVSIDGDFLRVSFQPSQAAFKKQLESKDKRTQIEEACKQALGRRLTLSITTGAEAANTAASKPEPDKSLAPSNPANHRAVKAIVEKFQGEVIEVVETER